MPDFHETFNQTGLTVCFSATGLKVDQIDMAIPFLTKIFGSRNDRLLKQYRKTVERINALESGLESLSDEELRAKTQNFRDRAANGESLDALLPEAFAVVREGSKRVMKMRHFDVQLAGGIALHNGKIAEMRTGEGKTLTSTLPAYLNAIAGKGVHVVTVNDYLASRDATWMGKRLTTPTSPMARTTSTVLTTCATTWFRRPVTGYNDRSTMPSLMKWTRF
jgi:hypothetical protein